MSKPSELAPREPDPPRRVPWALVAALWGAAVAQILGEFFTAPHTIQTMRLMSSLTFIFVGSGCAALCAWLIQRSTIDPHTTYALGMRPVYDAGRDKGFNEGYDKGYRDGRAASLGIVRLAPQPKTDAEEEPLRAEDSTIDGTGTDGTAPR